MHSFLVSVRASFQKKILSNIRQVSDEHTEKGGGKEKKRVLVSAMQRFNLKKKLTFYSKSLEEASIQSYGTTFEHSSIIASVYNPTLCGYMKKQTTNLGSSSWDIRWIVLYGKRIDFFEYKNGEH